MADVRPFPCVRPRVDRAAAVAALPYDVYSRAEAKAEIARNPHSFLRIDLASATLPDEVDEHDDRVYIRASALLAADTEDGIYEADEQPRYYFYRITADDGRSQTGVVGCSSVEDYRNGVIKRHEKTFPAKELDRIHHIDSCNAQTGPIFLAFRSDGMIEQVMERVCACPPLYDFVADDGIRHTVWPVDDVAEENLVRSAFQMTQATYIADGHHRAASAAKASMLRRERNREYGMDPTRQLACDHFLSILFPSNQLRIYDYNRVVADLNGHGKEAFLDRIREAFLLSEPKKETHRPAQKGEMGMYLDGEWYVLTVKEEYLSEDPVDGLDVSLLQKLLLKPILGIEDPRTDKRIEFVGGGRGLVELERRVAEDMEVAFSLFPTDIEELFAVADAGRLMPPKSTWFEPKPRSGLFIHRI